jgi:hypothetical protein
MVFPRPDVNASWQQQGFAQWRAEKVAKTLKYFISLSAV